MDKIIISQGGASKEIMEILINSISPDQIYLITPKRLEDNSKELENFISNKGINVKIISLKPNYWSEFFRITKELNELHSNAEIFMNTKGDCELNTISATAAFVNGIKAMDIKNKEIIMLPFFKFTYYTNLTDKKIQILKILDEDENCCKSLEELSQRTKMSLPLISYHINGNLKSEGLKKMGLVETEEIGSKISVRLSLQGKMMMKGFIEEINERKK